MVAIEVLFWIAALHFMSMSVHGAPIPDEPQAHAPADARHHEPFESLRPFDEQFVIVDPD